MNWEDYFEYDENSPSCLKWSKGTRYEGKFLTSKDKVSEDYSRWRVHVKGNTVRVHRIVWEMFNGEIPENMTIDHIDRNPLNNKINNLRCVPQSTNNKNRKKPSNNTSGRTGVNFRIDRLGNTQVRAQWHDSTGVKHEKSFSVNKYGIMEAFCLAAKYRENMLSYLIESGVPYSELHGK